LRQRERRETTRCARLERPAPVRKRRATTNVSHAAARTGPGEAHLHAARVDDLVEHATRPMVLPDVVPGNEELAGPPPGSVLPIAHHRAVAEVSLQHFLVASVRVPPESGERVMPAYLLPRLARNPLQPRHGLTYVDVPRASDPSQIRGPLVDAVHSRQVERPVEIGHR